MIPLKKSLLAVFSCFALLGAQGAFAETPEEDTFQAADKDSLAPIDDETVNAFAESYSSIQDIHSEYASVLSRIEDADEANAVQMKAQQEMTSAITDSGLTVEQYQGIASLVGSDEELRKRIQDALNN